MFVDLLTCDVSFSSVSPNCCPEERATKVGGTRTLYPKDYSKLLYRHKRQSSLDDPIEHEAEQAGRFNYSILGKVIRKCDEGQLDGLNHTL